MNVTQTKPKISLADKIIHLLSKQVVVQLVFVKQEENEYKISQIHLDKKSAEYIRKKCQYFIKDRKDWEVIEYWDDPDNEKSKGVVRIIDVNQIPYNRSILKKPTYVEKEITEELMKNTKIIGFRFEAPDKKSVVFLKKSDIGFFVIQNNRKYGMVAKGTATMFQGTLVKFPLDFDLVKYSDQMVIFHPYQFEEMFRYHELYERDRKDVFQHLKKKVDYKIELLDDYEDVIKNTPAKLRKFTPIKDKKIYTKTLKEIKDVLKIRPLKNLTITGKTLRFQDGSQGLINFLNDNYLHSHFTRKYYVVHSKTEV